LPLLDIAVFYLPPPPLGQGCDARDFPTLHVADRASGLGDYATSEAQDDAEVRAYDAQQSLQA